MNKSILLIDDEEVFHWITSQFLERVDGEIRISSCYNGQEGLDYLFNAEEIPDLILVDINMPIANGWIFLEGYLQELMDKKSKTKVFVVSSSIDPEDIKRAKSYPFVRDFISKPLTLEILHELINL